MNTELLIKEKVRKDILNTINLIKKCHSKSIYNKLLSDLCMLYKLASVLNIDDILEVDNYSFKSFYFNFSKKEKYQKDFYLQNYEYNCELTENYISLFNKYTDKCFKYQVTEMDYKENQDLVNDFLYGFDQKIYNIFKKSIKTHRVIYLDNDCNFDNDGITFYGHSFKPYILIDDYNSIFTSLTLVHEIGHIYDFSNSYLEKYNYTGEIYSHFLELVFADYLKDKNQDYMNLKYNYLDNLEESIVDLSNLLNESIITKLDFRQKYNQIYSNLEYTYGMILALEFYNIYIKDKELGMHYINEFSKNKNDLKDSFELINKFNKEKIKEGKTLVKYIKSINNR